MPYDARAEVQTRLMQHTRVMTISGSGPPKKFLYMHSSQNYLNCLCFDGKEWATLERKKKKCFLCQE